MSRKKAELLLGVLCGALLLFIALVAVGVPPWLAAATIVASLLVAAMLLAVIEALNWALDGANERPPTAS